MSAGGRDRRITLQRVHLVKTRLETLREFRPLATVWASHEPVQDGERMRAQQVAGAITDRFRVLWCAALRDLGPEDQLVFDGRTYGITGVKPIGRRHWLEITAVAEPERAA